MLYPSCTEADTEIDLCPSSLVIIVGFGFSLYVPNSEIEVFAISIVFKLLGFILDLSILKTISYSSSPILVSASLNPDTYVLTISPISAVVSPCCVSLLILGSNIILLVPVLMDFSTLDTPSMSFK